MAAKTTKKQQLLLSDTSVSTLYNNPLFVAQGKQTRHKKLDTKECLSDILELTVPAKKKAEGKKAHNSPIYEYARDPKTGKRNITNSQVSSAKRKTPSRKPKKIDDSEAYTPDSGLTLDDQNLIEITEEKTDAVVEKNRKEDLELLIAACEELTFSREETSSSSNWTQRVERESSMWERYRNLITEEFFMLQSFGSSAQACEHCGEKPPSIRCLQCDSAKFLCFSCDIFIHERNPLHDRDAWVDGHYKSLLPTEALDATKQIIEIDKTPLLHSKRCPKCFESNLQSHILPETCIIVNTRGRYDLSKYFVRCNSCSHTVDPFSFKSLFKVKLWPGSPESGAYFFDQEVFSLWNSFSKRMPGSSENAFIMSLNDISVEKGRCKEIHPQTFTKSFKEWKYFSFEMEQFQEKNWMMCPTCSISQHSCHVDGNFKVYRYKGAGRKRKENYYAGIFVQSNESVNEFLTETYQYRGGINVKVIWDGEWQAGAGRSTGEETEQTSKQLDLTSKKIENCLIEIGMSLSSVNIDVWVEEIKMLVSATSHAVDSPLSNKAEYILLASLVNNEGNLCISPDILHMKVPHMETLKFHGIPRKRPDQVKLLVERIAEFEEVDDSFHDAYGEVLTCVKEKLEKQIERIHYNIVHHSFLIKKVADRSKWRHVLRRLICKEKEKLDCHLQVYEECLALNDPLQMLTLSDKEDISNGKFPWRAHQLNNNASEETNETAAGALELSARYEAVNMSRDVLQGMLAEINPGIVFATDRICDGLFWFKKVTGLEFIAETEEDIQEYDKNDSELPSSLISEIRNLSEEMLQEDDMDQMGDGLLDDEILLPALSKPLRSYLMENWPLEAEKGQLEHVTAEEIGPCQPAESSQEEHGASFPVSAGQSDQNRVLSTSPYERMESLDIGPGTSFSIITDSSVEHSDNFGTVSLEAKDNLTTEDKKRNVNKKRKTKRSLPKECVNKWNILMKSRAQIFWPSMSDIGDEDMWGGKYWDCTFCNETRKEVTVNYTGHFEERNGERAYNELGKCSIVISKNDLLTLNNYLSLTKQSLK
eukprot:gene4099-4655_t